MSQFKSDHLMLTHEQYYMIAAVEPLEHNMQEANKFPTMSDYSSTSGSGCHTWCNQLHEHPAESSVSTCSWLHALKHNAASNFCETKHNKLPSLRSHMQEWTCLHAELACGHPAVKHGMVVALSHHGTSKYASIACLIVYLDSRSFHVNL